MLEPVVSLQLPSIHPDSLRLAFYGYALFTKQPPLSVF